MSKVPTDLAPADADELYRIAQGMRRSEAEAGRPVPDLSACIEQAWPVLERRLQARKAQRRQP